MTPKNENATNKSLFKVARRVTIKLFGIINNCNEKLDNHFSIRLQDLKFFNELQEC